MACHSLLQGIFQFNGYKVSVWDDEKFWRWIVVVIAHNVNMVAQLVKNPPAMQETLVRFLGWEDPLEKG